LLALGVDAKFQEKSMAKMTSHFDEWAEDTRLTNAEQRFGIMVLHCLIDIVTLQLTQRFMSMNNIIISFSIIFPKVYSLKSVHDITSHAAASQRVYTYD
jgi:hypothetical protein